MPDRWPPWEVTSLSDKLENLAAAVKSMTTDQPDDVRVWLSRFLVVRSCGYLEQVAYEVCRAYVRANSGGYVKSFAHSWLERTRNPSPDSLLELLGRFDKKLSDEFGEFLGEQDDYRRREILLLVDRRNKIAHGLNEGVDSRKAIQLKEVACEVADWFISRFSPKR